MATFFDRLKSPLSKPDSHIEVLKNKAKTDYSGYDNTTVSKEIRWCLFF